jgi:hypothetical protein
VYGTIADFVVKSDSLKIRDIDSSAHFTEFYGKESLEFVESKTINDSLPLQTFYNFVNIDLVTANKITKRFAYKCLGLMSAGFDLYNNNITDNKDSNNNTADNKDSGKNLAVEKLEKNINLLGVNRNLEVVNNLLSHMGLSSLNNKNNILLNSNPSLFTLDKKASLATVSPNSLVPYNPPNLDVTSSRCSIVKPKKKKKGRPSYKDTFK